ncbi:MAG: coproporphyrinogen III oxidase, partial [Gammaproteobacteria bacterium]|nr:coproporphyrinogen III oxidase [Gammaproteobacteria bacterium]
GFTFAELEAVHGPGLRAHLAGELEGLAPLAADGLVTLSDEGVRVNAWGQLFLRNVAMVFDNHRTRREAPV